MSKFEIVGGTKLEGEIRVSSSKNAVLPIIAGSILCDETVMICNIPMISDVRRMLDILTEMGGSVKIEDENAIINNSGLNHFG